MARICGIDIPDNKRVEISLTYIYGIGLTKAKAILKKSKVDPDTRVKNLSESELICLRDCITENVIEGDLRSKRMRDINRLRNIGCYRGVRHRRRLPVRGQRTHTNARTRKGKAVAITGKKKAPKK
ncbi:30S ribosomal protein S13 [bacterium]|jgi:small subunit ribosomal protein S13|nr:30S ribosomal protein S13 [bacterium]MBT3581152.1 30S ribosomal protein S13 [bacterium]MBT4551585.1 30S ribosomal protein S13 [bacterium]MBT5989169.1 30S ribosomal protein S13 [bacterium]MBT7088121.1 30S ribosomal protein S13 [bacterium]